MVWWFQSLETVSQRHSALRMSEETHSHLDRPNHFHLRTVQHLLTNRRLVRPFLFYQMSSYLPDNQRQRHVVLGRGRDLAGSVVQQPQDIFSRLH